MAETGDRKPVTPKPQARPRYLIDPSHACFHAAQDVAVAPGTAWEAAAAVPEGQELWQEDGDRVILTPDGWLVYVNGGGRMIYARLPGLRATEGMVRAIRGD